MRGLRGLGIRSRQGAHGSFQRVLFEDLVGHVKVHAVGGGGADLLDLIRGDDGAVVAEALADVAEYGGEFLVVEQAAEAHHGRHTFAGVEVLAVDLNRPPQTFEGDLDEACVVFDPVALGEGGVDVGDALAVGLVASGAVGVAGEDLFAECIDFLFGVAEFAGGAVGGVFGAGGGVLDLEGAGEITGGVRVVGEIKLTSGLQGGDVVFERVFEDVFGDGAHPFVERQFEGLERDAGTVGVVEPGGGDDGFEADAAMGVARGHHQEVGGVGDFFGIKTQHAGGGGAGFVFLGGEALLEQVGIGLVLRPGGPEGFAEVVLVTWVGFVERISPGFDGGDDFAGGATAKLAAGAVASAILGQLQIFQQLGDAGAVDFGRLHKRA